MNKLSALQNKDLISMLVKQAHRELQYSNVYLAYSYWFDAKSLQNLGLYFKLESECERRHSIQLLDYLNVRGVSITLDTIQGYQITQQKPQELIQEYQKLEDQNYQYLDQIGKTAQLQSESLTVKFIERMLTAQASSCDEAEKLAIQAQEYAQVPGLFYHFDSKLQIPANCSTPANILSFDNWKGGQGGQGQQ